MVGYFFFLNFAVLNTKLMKVLIIDTDKWSDRFAYEMGNFILNSTNRGGHPVNTPSYGNNGYGFTAPRTDEGFQLAKDHHITYVRENDLEKNILGPLKFYEGSRANVDYYLSEKARVEKVISDLEARDKSTFLPYPTENSVMVTLLSDEVETIDVLQSRAQLYCQENDINFVGFRYEMENPVKLKEETRNNVVSDRTDLKVLVKAYNNRLFIETLNPEEDDSDYRGAAGSVIGCTLINTKRLGLSNEAYELIKATRRGRDAIGDLCGEKNTFSWIGGLNAILGPKLEGSKYYQVVEDYVTIENDVPAEVIAIIDEREKIREIEFDDIKFDIWVEINHNRQYNHDIKEYVSDGKCSVTFSIHDAHIYNDKIVVVNAPDGCMRKYKESTEIRASKEAYLDVADLIFHNIFGANIRPRPVKKALEDESEIEKRIREFEERWDTFGSNRHSYSKSIEFSDAWDYANSFFDLGFRNNIMWPDENYFRLTFKGTISEIKEKLSNFKLVVSEKTV